MTKRTVQQLEAALIMLELADIDLHELDAFVHARAIVHHATADDLSIPELVSLYADNAHDELQDEHAEYWDEVKRLTAMLTAQ